MVQVITMMQIWLNTSQPELLTVSNSSMMLLNDEN